MRARIQSSFAALVLLLGLLAPLGSGYLCSMTGEMSRECCCEEEPVESARLTSNDACCTRVAFDAALPSGRQVVDAAPSAAVPVLFSVDTPLGPEPQGRIIAVEWMYPPPVAPIFQRNCTYLI